MKLKKVVCAVLVLVLAVLVASPALAKVQITTDSLPEATVSEDYSVNLNSRGSVSSVWALYYAIDKENNFPDGLSLSSSGEISGIPFETGVFKFWVSATNRYDATDIAYKEFTLRVVGETDAEPVVITTYWLATGKVGEDYSAKLVASGTGPIEFYVDNVENSENNFPAELLISTDGVISGVPSKEGTYTFWVAARNSFETVRKQLTLVVEEADEVPAAPPAILVQPQSATITEGETASTHVEATVSDDGTLSYQWYRTTRISYNSAMIIEGATSAIFAYPEEDPGEYYFFVSVTNTLGELTASTNSDIVALTVNAKPVEPVVEEERLELPTWNIILIGVSLALNALFAILLLARPAKRGNEE